MSVQRPKELEGKTKFQQLERSLKQGSISEFYWKDRLGGWGEQFYLLGLASWILGLLFALVRRQWWWELVLASWAALFVAMPSNWWARYVLFFILGTPLATLQVLRAIPARPWGKSLTTLLLALWGALGLATLGAGASGLSNAVQWRDTKGAARDAGRRYTIPQDAFRAHWTEDRERDLYRWLAGNIPRDATIGHQLHGGFTFAGMMFRPDFRNRVVQIDCNNPATFASCDLVAIGWQDWQIAPFRDAGWATPYDNGAFRVMMRPAPGP